MKRPYAKAAAILGAVAFLFTSGFARTEGHAAGTAGYLKSATYYSDDWVINFQNSESRHMGQELARIARDGFNNIILATPWREFQPDTPLYTYNQCARDEPDRVMDAAATRGLSVVLKVRYTWDYYGAGNVVDRHQGLMQEDTERSAWPEYVSRLYQAASSHENSYGGFLTWRDFWNFMDASASLGKGVKGRSMVRDYGYVDYTRENCELGGLEEMYGHKSSGHDDSYFPAKGSQTRSIFYRLHDQFLNGLLVDSQTMLPDLPMGIRLDADPVGHKGGNREGSMYPSIFPSRSAAYTNAMYGIPMGFMNEHERMTTAETLEEVPVFLNRLHIYSGGKSVYLDQFLFTDNTVGCEHNVQLRDDERSLYLEDVVPTLKNSTMECSIQTYRDYGGSKLFNAQFALGADGWRSPGGSYIVEDENRKPAVIPLGGNIYQNLGSRMMGNTGKDTYVKLRAGVEERCRLTIRMGPQIRTMDVKEERKMGLKFNSCQPSGFIISVNGGRDTYVDGVQVYTFVTQGELCGINGSGGKCIEALRLMNQKL